ncbi:MAG: META domain-containing protein [Agriterribacter sp.]
MKKNISLIVLVILMASCKNNSNNKTADDAATAPLGVSAPADTTHNSRNSLDWNGVYTGIVLSGNDSAQTVIQLNSNNTYSTETTIKGNGKPTETKGNINWGADGNTITIDNAKYQVREGSIAPLDPSGATTAISFKKLSDPLLEKYWKLIELNGKALDTTKLNKEPHIIFKSFDNRFFGNGSCNNFSGTYTLPGNGKIKLSQAISTRMACMNGMETETMLPQVLNKIDTYMISGDTLSVTKARMAPLAKFQAVYLR